MRISCTELNTGPWVDDGVGTVNREYYLRGNMRWSGTEVTNSSGDEGEGTDDNTGRMVRQLNKNGNSKTEGWTRERVGLNE